MGAGFSGKFGGMERNGTFDVLLLKQQAVVVGDCNHGHSVCGTGLPEKNVGAVLHVICSLCI
jgi:hypothetical protein